LTESVDPLEMAGDLAGRHATGIHGRDLVVEALELALVLSEQRSLGTMADSNTPVRSRGNGRTRSLEYDPHTEPETHAPLSA